MNDAVDRYNFAKRGIKVPRSPSASDTKMAQRMRSERNRQQQYTGNSHGRRDVDVRGVVTPAAIRASMPPVRDLEFEYLKKFQTDLYRVIQRRKTEGCYHAEFTVVSRELDEYTLDFIFNKLVAVLRHEKFFVCLGDNMPRSFVVSWDPILTKDSISQEEWNDPNSVASVRTRRFLRLQRKHEQLATDEQETTRQFKHYLDVMNESESVPTTLGRGDEGGGQLNDDQNRANASLGALQSATHGRSFYDERDNYSRQTSAQQVGGDHSLRIDCDAQARKMVMNDLLRMARFEEPTEIRAANSDDNIDEFDVFASEPLVNETNNPAPSPETLRMMQMADQAAGAGNDDESGDAEHALHDDPESRGEGDKDSPFDVQLVENSESQNES